MAISRAIRTVGVPALGAIAISPRIFVSCFTRAPIAHFVSVAFELKRPDRKLVGTIARTQFRTSKPFDCCNIQRPGAPANFPFEIEDDIYESSIIKLKREYAGEKIVVDVDEPTYPKYDHTKKKKEQPGFHTPLELTMTITKENGENLRIFVFANVDCVELSRKFYINSKPVTLVMTRDKEDYWREFIKERGIDDSIGRYMMNYMNWRAAQKHLIFWENVKNFFKE